MRQKALADKKIGPVIMITGSQRSGKSTLCKMLINYSLKLGWTPLYADLDLSTNEITPPGTISITQVDQPLPNDDITEQALTYFHGKPTPITQDFYDQQIKELADYSQLKLKTDLDSFLKSHHLDEEGKA